jgi:ATP-dependent RNA helicase DeaD
MAPRPEKADRKQRYGSSKLRSDDFEQPAERPTTRPAEQTEARATIRPAKSAKPFPKDKGKPKWSKPAAEGEARPPKKKAAKPKDHKKTRAAD